MFPINVLDWLPSDSLAYQVRDIVCEFDLTLVHAAYGKDGRGAPAFSPQMMLSVLLYAQYKGVMSSRGTMRLCAEDIGGRFLCGNEIPDFRSIALFRVRHAESIRELFKQSIKLCEAAGMVSLRRVAVDGTKIAGAGSKDSSKTYARILQDEEALDKEVAALVQAGIDEDAADNASLGTDDDGFSAPEHLKNRADRIAAIRAAKAELAAARSALLARAREKAAAARKEWDETAPKDRPHTKKPDPETAVPADKDRYNFADPESRMMKGRGQYVQGWNAQACVDSDCQVIIACAVTDECTDYGQLAPLVEQAAANMGRLPDLTLADAGYFDHKDIRALEEKGHALLVPPNNEWSRDKSVGEPLSDAEREELTVRERMGREVSSAQGRADYAWRMITNEPVFGQIKGSPGHPLFTRFLRRGIKRSDADWSFTCAAHNLRKLIRFRQKQQEETTSKRETPKVRLPEDNQCQLAFGGA